MAIIIEHEPTGHRYLLLGAGYGTWAAARNVGSSRTIRSVTPAGKSGESHQLAVCDAAGEIVWMAPEEARVVCVDGDDPADVLTAFEAVHPRPEPREAADAA
ncbi:MAG: hypothetical protein DHS20C14_20970 [Phycisphaeraceae bacterium]|nr:MAG: hypothetical protein DHS20C14_20970 [Phycisphaeraceae bacterium]